MTEIAARLPRPRDLSRAPQLFVLAAGAALVAAGLLVLLGRAGTQHVATASVPAARVQPRAHEPAAPAPPQRVAPLRWTGALDAALADGAARGFAHGLYAYGATTAAGRVARWWPQILRVSRGSGF